VRRPALQLALGLLATLVCASAPAAPGAASKLVARTSRASYYSVGHASVDVRRSEAYLERLESLFGNAPDGWSFTVVVHPKDTVLLTAEGAAARGITDLAARRIDSVLGFHPHELVHAVAGRLGTPPVVFAEGLAVALSSGGRWGGRNLDAVAGGALLAGARLEALVDRFGENPDVDYPMAGSFVAFLLDTHGIEVMVAFLERCDVSHAGFENAFRSAFGSSFARMSITWRARLARSGGSSWDWSDSRTWPASLRRPRAASGPAISAASVPAMPTSASRW
jgi:hypothetical protein